MHNKCIFVDNKNSNIASARPATLVEFADAWLKAAERWWYPGHGGRTSFFAMPHEARHDYARWWAILTDLITIAGAARPLAEIRLEILDQWVAEKMDREVPREEIARDVGWLWTMLDYAVNCKYVDFNIMNERPPYMPASYTGHVPGTSVSLARPRPNPVASARALRARMKAEGLTTSQLARRLGLNQARVWKGLALLDLPPEIRDGVEAGKIPPSTALEIGRHPDAATQRELAESVAKGELRRQDVMGIVRASLNRSEGEAVPGSRGRHVCPVRLKGPGLPVVVLGVERPPIRSRRAYDALAFLVRHWPHRTDLKALERPPSKGGCGKSARYHLKRLKSGPDTPWFARIIDFGGPCGGYGLLAPAPAGEGDSQTLTEFSRVSGRSDRETGPFSVVG